MPPGPGDEPTFYGDPDLAARRAECSANVSACAGLGRELERAIGLAGGNTSREQTLNDETRGWLREARAAHVRACDAGVAQSCNAEASLARDALDRDARHVEKFYLRGCDGGFALSCSYLADIYARGLASTVPGIRSTRFAGEPEIRTPTGIDDPKRPAIAKDPARSAEFYRRACGLGDRDGCRLEGMTLQESAATAADPLRTRANEIFARLCHRGDSSSCMFLARNAEAAGGAIAGNSTAYWRTHTCLFGSGQYCER
jgi:TPR repeat protein